MSNQIYQQQTIIPSAVKVNKTSIQLNRLWSSINQELQEYTTYLKEHAYFTSFSTEQTSNVLLQELNYIREGLDRRNKLIQEGRFLENELFIKDDTHTKTQLNSIREQLSKFKEKVKNKYSESV